MASPAWTEPPSPPPPLPEAGLSLLRLDSPLNRELLMDAIRLLELYTRTERGRGRGRPTIRWRAQQDRRLDDLADRLEELR
jgi:hypothetical protein